MIQSNQQFHQCGFPRTRWADKGDGFALSDIKANVVERALLCGLVLEANLVEFQCFDVRRDAWLSRLAVPVSSASVLRSCPETPLLHDR